jgi:uncharacterized protein (DUF58 family)
MLALKDDKSRKLPILGARRRAADAGDFDHTLAAWHFVYYLAGVLALVSLVVREPLLFLAAIIILIVGVVPEVWYRYVPDGLRVGQEPSPPRAMFGDVVELDLHVENRLPLPLPWVLVRDEMPDSLPFEQVRLRRSVKSERAVLESTLALWAYQRVRRKYKVLAAWRGAHELGPVSFVVSDPFGLLTREYTREARCTLLVHPPVAPLQQFGLDPFAPFGQIKGSRKLLEDPLFTNGVRPYMVGDEPRRIHWKATAKTGELQSKVYDPSARHTVAIFLDVRTISQIRLGTDRILAELAIACAASVARWALDQKYSVGLYSNGTLSAAPIATTAAPSTEYDTTSSEETPTNESRFASDQAQFSGLVRLRVPPSSRGEQLSRLLDGLARLLPYYGMPMDLLVALEERRLPRGATIVFIGTEGVVDVPLIVALRRARAHGYDVSLLLTHNDEMEDTNADGQAYLADFNTHRIGGQHVWEDIVSSVLGKNRNRQATSTAGPFDSMPGDSGDDQPVLVTPGVVSNGDAYEPRRESGPRVPRPIVMD